jgi:hypothetical protein
MHNKWFPGFIAILFLMAIFPQLAERLGQPTNLIPSAHAGSGISEKEAFESAKELGTIEAWEAFLNRFSTGFRADLARAYVKRLGAKAAPAKATPTEAPASVAKKPRVTPRLKTVHARPGNSSWRTTRYNGDDGGGLEPAASVASDGVELLLYCNRSKRIGAVVRESGRDRYPDFEARVQQGLESIRRGRDKAYVPIEFSNGAQYPVSAELDDRTGELRLGYLAKGGGFRSDGGLITEMMSGAAVNVSAPPFNATLQLTGSRKAICSMSKSCGVKASGCASERKYVTPKKKKKSYKKKKKKKRKCISGSTPCTRNSQCCSGKCCKDDFEECEGWYGKCA